MVKHVYSLWPMPKSIFSAGQEKLQTLLKSTRENAGLTQAALAKKLKRPQSYVSKYESGERRLDLIELNEICNSIGIPLNDFVNKFVRLK
jgi:transcriptional regulator with XRE-family HTH domain